MQYSGMRMNSKAIIIREMNSIVKRNSKLVNIEKAREERRKKEIQPE